MSIQLHRERRRLLISVEKLMEGPMIFLSFLWLALLIAEFIWGLTKPLEYLSLTIWAIFILDFVIKFIIAPEKLIFLKKNWLTVISLLVPALRLFRAFRIIRLTRGLRGVRLVRTVSSLNRGMRGLAATMKRRKFGYVVTLSVVIVFAGAAGMYAIEKGNVGFENYGMAVWWTAMRVITAGSDFWPSTPEGRVFAFLLSLYGFAVFGYVTATLATFFIGRDAEEKEAPLIGASDVIDLKNEIRKLAASIHKLGYKVDEQNDETTP